MLSVLHINFKYITVLFCLFSLLGRAQNDSSDYKIESRFKAEYSPYFKFKKFQRGLDAEILTKRLDSLSTKKKSKWTREDSILFAKTNLLAGNTKLAEHYFSNTKIDPKYNFNDNVHDLMSIYIAKDFDKGIKKIKRNYPQIIQQSQIYFLKHIFECQDSIRKKNAWYKSEPNVLNFKIDSNLIHINKKDERFKNEIIIPLENATKILQILVLYIHEDDHVISRSFNEMGETLEKYVSLSQAYIAYSIARNYNKRDKQILQNIKDIKGKLVLKNYKIPNFRKYFPRTEEWRFDYDILKEKINNKTPIQTNLSPPVLRIKKNEPKISFPPEIIIPIGLLLFFILILLFLIKHYFSYGTYS